MSPAAATQRVLVVDDDEGVCRLVEKILKRGGYEAFAAADGESALAQAAERSPHLVILDLSLPGLSGLDVCRQLRAWFNGPILVLSGNGEEAMIVRALDRGADDYLTKPFRAGELLARMRALFRRAARDSHEDSVIEIGDLRVDFSKRRATRGGQEIALTRTEFEIVGCLIRHAERVVTSEMILRQVWGPHHGEYAQTLRVHIGHIRRKIEPDPSRPCYILTETGVGYRLSAPQLAGEAASAG